MVDRYLDLLARTLTRYEMDSPFRAPDRTRLKPAARKAWDTVQGVLSKRQLALVRTQKWDYSLREEGKDWPSEAETMVGLKRLQNLRDCIETIIADGVEGDLVETGVWRGGASIFMRACLVANGGAARQVYLCDSYEGLPPPDLENYPQDSKLALHEFDYLAVSKEQVQGNFRKYDLLDDNVHFVKGWFKDTMPTLPVEKIALLRLDGDMYESTIQVLEGIYDKVVPGGFIVVDDYLSFPECKQACEDFRKARGITDPIETIDWSGVFWRKSA
jgi:hypothetical protein